MLTYRSVPSFSMLRIVCVMLLFSAHQLYAQDTIVKRNEEKIIAKILEVNLSDIKYKQFDYQDGPVFTAQKWELNYIRYANGVKEEFEKFPSPITNHEVLKTDLTIQPAGKYYYYKTQKIGEQDMLDVAWKLQDKKINLMIKKTEDKKVAKNIFLISGFAIGTVALLKFSGAISAYNSHANNATMGKGRHPRSLQRAERIEARRTGSYLLAAALGCEIVSFVFRKQETRHAHMVVTLYNNAILQ